MQQAAETAGAVVEGVGLCGLIHSDDVVVFFPPTFFLLFVTHGGSVGTNNRALCFVPKACLSSGLKWHSFVCVTDPQ